MGQSRFSLNGQEHTHTDTWVITSSQAQNIQIPVTEALCKPNNCTLYLGPFCNTGLLPTFLLFAPKKIVQVGTLCKHTFQLQRMHVQSRIEKDLGMNTKNVDWMFWRRGKWAEWEGWKRHHQNSYAIWSSDISKGENEQQKEKGQGIRDIKEGFLGNVLLWRCYRGRCDRKRLQLDESNIWKAYKHKLKVKVEVVHGT